MPHCQNISKIQQNRRNTDTIDTLPHKYMTAPFHVLVQALQQKVKYEKIKKKSKTWQQDGSYCQPKHHALQNRSHFTCFGVTKILIAQKTRQAT